MSLEDDSGSISVIVWPDVLQRFDKAVLYSQLMLVYGVWQRDNTIDPQAPGQVQHLLAQWVGDGTHLLADLMGATAIASRDFH